MLKVNTIYLQLKQDILNHRYPINQFLPNESKLCKEYNCAKNTFSKALYRLEQEGYVRVISGHGVLCLSASHVNFFSSNHQSFKEASHDNALITKTVLLKKVNKVISTRESLLSHFPRQTPVVKIKRLRYVNNQPVILDINYFNPKFIPKLSKQIIEDSIYEYIEQQGITIAWIDKKIVFEQPSVIDYHLFGSKIVGLIVVHNYVYDDDDNLIEYTQSRHLPEFFNFRSHCQRL